MTIGSSMKTETAHEVLYEIARTITESPLANPGGAVHNVSLNSRIALLTNALAGHHLSVLDGSEEALVRQGRLLEVSDPHMQALSDEMWELITLKTPDQNCLTATDDQGYIEHACIHDEKPLPCITCPMLTRQMPEIGRGVPRRPHPAAQAAQRPDLRRAAAAMARVTELTERWAGLMLEREGRPEPAGVAAALAAAETLYYLSAALEYYPKRSNSPVRHAGKPYDSAFDRLYEAMGGPEGPTAGRAGEDYGCLRYLWAERITTEYRCRDPETAGPTGERPTPCDSCAFSEGPGKPMPWELLAQAADRERKQP